MGNKTRIKTINKQDEDTSHVFKKTRAKVLREEAVKDWRLQIKEFLTNNKDEDDRSATKTTTD